MSICINCGKESDNCLCGECRQILDIGELCGTIISYKPGSGGNETWDNISSELFNPFNFRNIVFALTDELPSPQKELLRIRAIAEDSSRVPKQSRNWLYIVSKICIESSVGNDEKNWVRGLVLDALYKDYYFAEADEMANELMKQERLPKQAYCTLGEFYIKTRRYDGADVILSTAQSLFEGDDNIQSRINSLLIDNAKQRAKAEAGKAEYMPNPKENKEAVRQKYVDFLESIGIKADIPTAKKKTPEPLRKEEYPAPIETRDADFDTFVAFDLETTGKNPKMDAIVEIGAVKVENGKIIETDRFLFQEYVNPYKQKVSEEIERLTGISNEDVKDARKMWEVFPDFMEFAGGYVLVGFNCMKLGSRFLARAGRYSHLIIENKYFDVMRYAEKFRDELQIEGKGINLKYMCEKLGIENPRAHRALADAVTIANVYLKLRAMEQQTENATVDDMLADLDEW